MKIKMIIMAMALTLLMGTVAFADTETDFMLVGGDEYICVEGLEELEINCEKIGDTFHIGTTNFNIKKEVLSDEGKLYLPFKKVMEISDFDFQYTETDKMRISNGDITLQYKINKKNKEVVQNYNNEDYKTKKNENLLISEPNMKLHMASEIAYIEVEALKTLDLTYRYEDKLIIIKSEKMDEVHEFSIENMSFENKNYVSIIKVLEAYEFAYEMFDDKLVVTTNGQKIVFQK